MTPTKCRPWMVFWLWNHSGQRRLLPRPENSNSEGVCCSEEVEHLGAQVTWSRYLSLSQNSCTVPSTIPPDSEDTVHTACLSRLPTPVSRNCTRLQGAGRCLTLDGRLSSTLAGQVWWRIVSRCSSMTADGWHSYR